MTTIHSVSSREFCTPVSIQVFPNYIMTFEIILFEVEGRRGDEAKLSITPRFNVPETEDKICLEISQPNYF